MTPEAEGYREQLRAMQPELRERYVVATIGLFGSRVPGNHWPDSDLDVLVTFEPEARLSVFDLAGLELKLEDRLVVRVEVALRNNLKPRLRPYILREIVTVNPPPAEPPA